MNWRTLDETIRDFASSHNMEIIVKDVNYPGGQLTKYRLVERDFLFYELKLVKPIESYGSKFRVLSPFNEGNLEIKLRTSIFGKSKLSTSEQIEGRIKSLIEHLSLEIKDFTWRKTTSQTAWPSKLHKSNALEFECDQIEFSIETLNQIRNIHIYLSGHQ